MLDSCTRFSCAPFVRRARPQEKKTAHENTTAATARSDGQTDGGLRVARCFLLCSPITKTDNEDVLVGAGGGPAVRLDCAGPGLLALCQFRRRASRRGLRLRRDFVRPPLQYHVRETVVVARRRTRRWVGECAFAIVVNLRAHRPQPRVQSVTPCNGDRRKVGF